jgi:spermidine synthase
LHIAWGRGGLLLVYDIDSPKGSLRVLRSGGVYQSASFLGERRFDLPFAYLEAFDHVFEMAQPVRDLLLIGGGGYAYPKHVLTERPDVHLDVVELHPTCTRLARRYLFLDELEQRAGDRLCIYHDDGKRFVAAATKRYDAIIDDAFRGESPDATMNEKDGLSHVKAALGPGGCYLVNLVASRGTQDYENAVHVLRQAFSHVWVLDAIDQELGGASNYLLVASDAEHPFTDVVEHQIGSIVS